MDEKKILLNFTGGGEGFALDGNNLTDIDRRNDYVFPVWRNHSQ